MATFLELYCDQGSDFSFTMDITNDDGSPMNVASQTFASSIRKSYYSSRVTANLTVSVLNTANGNLILSMNSGTTANIKAGRYLYDLKMKSGNTSTRIIEGIITVSPQITK